MNLINIFRVTINIPGFGEVAVDIEYLCECDSCAKDLNSKLCSLAGTYQCGKCQCNPGRYGCDCKCDSSKESHNDTSTCIDPQSGGIDGVLCNGRGECVCGECECEERNVRFIDVEFLEAF